MPVPHFNIKITQRSKGKSAVAGAAYQAGEKLFSEYDQKTKNYTCKKEVVYTEIMLPPNAPPEYADRAALWNSVEEIEKQWNSQLARRFVAALPREVPMELLPQMVKEYCEEHFVSKGMCCDFAIHDPDPPGHNPHCHFMDGIEGLRSLPQHSVDMLLTDPPYGTTRNFWDVPLPLPELWEAVRWAVKPEGAVLFFAQCPYDKVLGASNLPMLRYEWVWYKSRCTGFLNARRAPLKRTENILVFYQKLPYYDPQFEQGKPYKKTADRGGNSPNYGKFVRSGGGSEDGLRFPGNLLTFPSVQRTVHPTQKPVELCEYFIKTYTRPGEVVADICAGSGTTAVAAVNTGRRFICFETAPAFYAPATERIRLAQAAAEAGEKGV